MRFGLRTKIVLGLLAALVAVGYLIVVDLGIHAGRIHRGVSIEGGISVGGLTVTEATAKLSEIEESLENDPLVFVAEGFDCRFAPSELGFDARPASTAQRAMEVGRHDAPFGALVDRMRAWVGGVTVEWTDIPNTRKVGRFLNQCEELATSLGLEINRPRLRFLLKRAIVQWPREQLHQIPVVDES